MGMVEEDEEEEDRSKSGNTSFPSATPLGMTSHDTPEYTDSHTRPAGASEPEYFKLSADITTAGVNLAGLSFGMPSRTPPPAPPLYIHTPFPLFFVLFFVLFFDPGKLSRLEQLPAA